MARPRKLTAALINEAFAYFITGKSMDEAAKLINVSATALYTSEQTRDWVKLRDSIQEHNNKAAVAIITDKVADNIEEFASNLGGGVLLLSKKFIKEAEKGEIDLPSLEKLTQIAERLSKITSKVSPDQGKQRYEFEVKLSAPKPAEPMKQVFDVSNAELVDSPCVRDMQVVVTTITDSDKT